MVKEVETHNSTEVLASGLALSPETYPDIVTGVLSSNGLVLTAMVNRQLAAGYVRGVYLSYMLPISEQQMVAEYPMGSFEPAVVDETEEYAFDLSPVMTQILHDPPEQMPDDTINVRLYTYESNTPFNYGTCYPTWSPIIAYIFGDYVQYADRLWQCAVANIGQLPSNPAYWTYVGVPSSGTISINVPYTVSFPGMAVMPVSTDGWYVMRVIDLVEYDDNDSYVVGDIVYYSGFYKCIQDTAGGNDPEDTDYWIGLTDEEFSNIFSLGYYSANTIDTILNTDLLITRYVKQKHIYELLAKTSFKKYDDIRTVAQVEKIISMREAAIVYLNSNDPIRARRMLDDIIITVNSFRANTGEGTITGTITNFTL